jgi:Uncharacterised protein family (UPF0180).
MTICIEEELEMIKSELIKRGYNVVTKMNEVPCDALICNVKDGGLTNYSNQGNLKREGTLIIDCGSKTVDEIEYILNNRVYTANEIQ